MASDVGAERREGVRRLVVVLIVVAVLVGAAILLLVLTEDGAGPGDRLFSDEFSEATDTWNPDVGEGISSEITGGSYEMSFDAPHASKLDSAAFEVTESIRVRTSVAIGRSSRGAAVGLACGFSDSASDSPSGLFGDYRAQLDTSGRVRISRMLTGHEKTLGVGKAPATFSPGDALDLEMRCLYADDEAEIVLRVGNAPTVSARDGNPVAPFGSAGMIARTRASGLRVRFDYIEVTAIGSR